MYRVNIKKTKQNKFKVICVHYQIGIMEAGSEDNEYPACKESMTHLQEQYSQNKWQSSGNSLQIYPLHDMVNSYPEE